MDFKAICNGIKNTSCVISVEKTKDGYGDIRIVDGNKDYIDSFKNNIGNNSFVPNSVYTKYMDRNLNFEEFCYKSAVKKELLHSYAYPERYGAWFHMLYIPLDYEEENLAYCLYIMEINQEFDSTKLSNSDNNIANEVLKTTLQLSNTKDFKAAMKNVIKEIRELCKAAFCCILLVNDYNDDIEVLAEDRDLNSDRKQMQEYMDEMFCKIVKTWQDTLGDNNCIIISNEKGMEYLKEKNKLWYDSLVRESIDSLVLFPLKSVDKLIGYIWVSNFKAEDTIAIKETLEITTFILGSEIGNYLLLKQLTVLSTIDLLTGLYNRNEMNNFMDRLAKSENNQSLALLFFDINGLKAINDKEGHLIGDALIKRAAYTLKSVFKYTPIFRAGGDEFTVIIENAKDDEIFKLIDKVREESKKNNVSFSIGCSIKENTNDVLIALKEADELMYEDKRKYYNKVSKC